MMKKGIFFDELGEGHDAFILQEGPNGAKILYHPGQIRRFWNFPETAKQKSKWIEIDNVQLKKKPEELTNDDIIIVKVKLGDKVIDTGKNVKSCYKVIE